MPDIDIDFADRTIILEKLPHRIATISTGKKHNTGIYVNEIPHNPIDFLSTIDYKAAEERGYIKLDFLNVSIYKDVRDEEHLIKLMNQEPIWELLEHEDFVNQVFHINGHADLLKQLKPKSVEQLAATLSIIRPAKRYLMNKSWDEILKEVWIKPTNNDYYFKKSHAFSYAFACIIHMNLIYESLHG